MKIQSLSVVVPNQRCINNCKPCVSKMHCSNYKDQLNENIPFFDLYLNEFIKRMEYARHNGCNTVMLTGCSEPQQNRKFLSYFGMIQRMMKDPFQCVEMQTTGVMIDEPYLRFLRNHVGVSLISISLFSLDSDTNAAIIEPPAGHEVDIQHLCSEIKRYDFSLRLSLNLTKEYDQYASNPRPLFEKCRALGANQVTLRVLYSSGNGTPQDEWIKENAAAKETVDSLRRCIKLNGNLLGRLPHGASKYSLSGLCIVLDDDCMDKAEKTGEDYKYLILQPDCKLYSAWDDPASCIF